MQLEGFDAELESLQTGGGKKRGKPPPRLTHLEESISRHKTHVARLEAIMRLIDNGEPGHAGPARVVQAMPLRSYTAAGAARNVLPAYLPGHQSTAVVHLAASHALRGLPSAAVSANMPLPLVTAQGSLSRGNGG